MILFYSKKIKQENEIQEESVDLRVMNFNSQKIC